MENNISLLLKDKLDNVLLDIDRIESLNGLLNRVAEDMDNTNQANKVYSLSYANDMLLKSMQDKIDTVYKIINDLNQVKGVNNATQF